MTQADLIKLLKRLEKASHRTLAQRREHEDVGCFRAYFDATEDMIWLNYAAPYLPLPMAVGELDQQLAELRHRFEARSRTLRFEFTAALWPELPASLLRNGLKLQAEQPLMLCTAKSFVLRSTSP